MFPRSGCTTPCEPAAVASAVLPAASARAGTLRAIARLTGAPEARKRPDCLSAGPAGRPQSPALREHGYASVEVLRDLSARVFVGALFALMSWNLLGDFMRTGHVTGLLLLASESLVVVLTIVRRRAHTTDRSVVAALMTTVSLAGPPLVRSAHMDPLAPDVVTALISAAGLLLVIAAKVTLGRSFGIAPANRGVVARGPYNLVRHPIYTGYIVTHIAFVMAHPSPWNVAILAAADISLVVRALLEERVLGGDAQYQAYCARVGWHLVPGVF
jgi:protein-S-isoprenylcysteine O-methyltransferase Ste14